MLAGIIAALTFIYFIILFYPFLVVLVAVCQPLLKIFNNNNNNK